MLLYYKRWTGKRWTHLEGHVACRHLRFLLCDRLVLWLLGEDFNPSDALRVARAGVCCMHVSIYMHIHT